MISQKGNKLFLNNEFIDFDYASYGERLKDVQLLSSNIFRDTTMGAHTTVFGINVADSRIKVLPLGDLRSRSGKKYTVRFVPGNLEYGKNKFKDNKDGTISNLAPVLFLQLSESKKEISWGNTLSSVQQKNNFHTSITK